ncbi:MAG TPA: hypothetical protein VFO16_01790 [Pseudonocardiaceae bacterium]|nr:hypothetical protein [Pseudonocardiaceae bacterium]
MARPALAEASALVALCREVLIPGDIETVNPGEGMPCTRCVLRHATFAEGLLSRALDPPDTVEPPLNGLTYQQWGWPVTVHNGQVRLSLDHDVSALMIPSPLGSRVTSILNQRRCAPPVLADPCAPERYIVLTGERYGLQLPWPERTHELTGVVLLPPTRTPRGPIIWIKTPQPDSLHLCREIDLFAALHGIGRSQR